MATRRRKPTSPAREGDKSDAALDKAAKKAPASRARALHGGQLIQSKLNTAQATKPLDAASPIEIELPSLENISVTLRAPAPPNHHAIEQRRAEIVRAHLPFLPREPGQPIVAGDEILVDAVGYVQGALFSSQMDTWLKVEPNPLLPGLFEALIGTEVGHHTVVPLTLPADYPDQALQNAQAAFAVDVRAANAPAGDVDAAILLSELGYGGDEDAITQSIRAEIEEALALDLVARARELVLDELQTRAPGTIAPSLIEAEVQKAFRVEQGIHLAKTGVSLDDQNVVFDAFKNDVERQTRVRRKLWEAHFLDALADHLQVDDDKGSLIKLMTKLASAAGLTAASVHTAVKADEQSEEKLVQNLRRSRAVEKLLEGVEVSFLPHDAPD